MPARHVEPPYNQRHAHAAPQRGNTEPPRCMSCAAMQADRMRAAMHAPRARTAQPEPPRAARAAHASASAPSASCCSSSKLWYAARLRNTTSRLRATSGRTVLVSDPPHCLQLPHRCSVAICAAADEWRGGARGVNGSKVSGECGWGPSPPSLAAARGRMHAGKHAARAAPRSPHARPPACTCGTAGPAARTRAYARPGA